MSLDETYIGTRRQLRCVGESLIAGPQYRVAGTVRLAVRPDGFAGVAIPLAVRGTELVLPNDAVPLAGSLAEVADIAGVDVGPPDGVYDIVDPLPPHADLKLDLSAAEWIHRSHYAGGHAIKNVLPEQHPVLWPEHFDVAATEDEAARDQHGQPTGAAAPRPRRRPTGARGLSGRSLMSLDAMDCNELVEMVTAYLDDALDGDTKARFESPLGDCDGCDGCENYLQQLRETVRTAGKIRDDELDPAFRSRLLDAFKDFR